MFDVGAPKFSAQMLFCFVFYVCKVEIKVCA